MKKLLFIGVTLLLLKQNTNAQVIMGFKFSPNNAFAFVKDRNSAFDGNTVKEANKKGVGLGATFDFALQDNLYFGTGVMFTQKNIMIRNSMGWYSGTSNYNIAYMQLPILAKYRTGEVFLDKMNLVFGAGPMLDLKLREAVGSGGDGAHYKNLANNDFYTDPFRGSNGNNKSVPLFSPINIGLYITAGAEYQLLDNLAITAGFSANPSFMNMINPRLTYDDISKTRVKDDLLITTNVISFDLGIKLGGK